MLEVRLYLDLRYYNIVECECMSKCVLEAQGYVSCGNTIGLGNSYVRPCEAGFRVKDGIVERLIYDVVLSRPEDYLSIYQSCCNHNCLKCHSWYFSQHPRGSWYSPKRVLEEALRYENMVTVVEPRDRSTMWHASDLCAHCGSCLVQDSRGPYCPGVLSRDQVLLSPQGYGPARNIISFTGGDLYCRTRFYIETFKLLKRETNLWIHIETNGYGLTPKNLDQLYSAGLDSIWLDMKAYNEETYRKLCGTTNKWILELPARIVDMGLVLEVVLILIPELVYFNDIEGFAKLLSNVDRDLPVTLLAFFPEYLLLGYRSPTFEEMVKAYNILVDYGLRNVRLGNIGVFCKDRESLDLLIRTVGREHVGL